jgi:hypothetical protein
VAVPLKGIVLHIFDAAPDLSLVARCLRFSRSMIAERATYCYLTATTHTILMNMEYRTADYMYMMSENIRESRKRFIWCYHISVVTNWISEIVRKTA